MGIFVGIWDGIQKKDKILMNIFIDVDNIKGNLLNVCGQVTCVTYLECCLLPRPNWPQPRC